jgi:SAM-dependent methyltransferase
MKCPLCETEMEKLGEFPFADFDGSLFNCRADLMGCSPCDFIRVAFPFSDKELSDYYEQSESLYTSLSGVGVGGNSTEDLARYAHGLNIVSAIPGTGSVVDVGCSRGGFLNYVRDHTAWNVHGIEIDRNALASLEQIGIPASFGSAAALPLAPESQELLTYFHVLEHVNDVHGILSEMARVLAPGGHVLIEVPDAQHYLDARVGDWFWLAMKEHVNHFSATALCRALERHGLIPERIEQSRLPMKNNTTYPSLVVLAKKERNAEIRNRAVKETPLGWFREYVDSETRSFERTAERLRIFCRGKNAVYFWGIGLEFLNLAAHKIILAEKEGKSTDLLLIDQNKEKQKRTVRNRSIAAANSIARDGGLVVVSYLSGDEIATAAIRSGWDQKAIFRI